MRHPALYPVALLVASLSVPLASCKKRLPSGGQSTAAPASAERQVTGIRFQRKVPAAGTIATIDDSMEMRIEMKAQEKGGVPATLVNREIRKRKRTVLRANDQFVTKLGVTYLDDKAEEEVDGKKREVPSPIKGKSYVVEWDGAGSTVVHESGGKASEEERERVLEGEYDVGKRNDEALFIPDRPLRVGERFDASGATIRALLAMEEKDKVSLERANFTFTGTRQDGNKTYGLFDSVLIVTFWPKETPNMKLRMETTGKMSVDIETAWIRDFSLEGPVTIKVEGKQGKVEAEGSGTIKQSGTAIY